ncbi:hypothetical protein PENSPDRAFT_756510 [Peniophora sp. CONT]|nr:hypothetical protein PENSPDRAFT_756510 [Peniophora sp. CONT]
MKRRSQGGTSVTKQSSPAPLPSSPGTSKRDRPGDEQHPDDTDIPSKRQRLDPLPPDLTENSDRTLVEESGGNTSSSPLTNPKGEEQGPRVPPPSTRSAGPEERAPQRSDKFWYQDGSVVLQIGRVLFRLHKSLLSAQSSFFHELFIDPYRPADEYDAGAGVILPFYVLSVEGLRVFDFERLLETLENPHIITRLKNRPTFDVLSAVARAAHILEFAHTLQWTKDELDWYWTSDLSEVEDVPEECIEDAMAALQLSRDADIPEIRKAAFYELLRLPNFGQNDEDTPLVLCHADYNLLTRARQHCAQVWMDVLLIPPPRSDLCVEQENKRGKTRCGARSESMLKSGWLTFVGDEDLRKYSIDPVAGFRALRKFNIPKEDKGGFCAECRRSWRDMWKKKVIQFWEGLDKALDLVPVEAQETVEVVG